MFCTITQEQRSSISVYTFQSEQNKRIQKPENYTPVSETTIIYRIFRYITRI
jgi:hypothetical protein